MSKKLHSIFRKATPVNADEFFQFAEMINIIPGVNAKYESFVVKCTLGCLEKGSVVAVFNDTLGGAGQFIDFDLNGVAQLVETSPSIFKFHELESSFVSIVYPEIMKLELTRTVFALNSFALGLLATEFTKQFSVPS